MMEFILYFLVFLLLVHYYFTKSFNHWKNKNVPYLKPLPFVGNVFNGILMKISFGEVFTEFYRKTKEPILGCFILHRPCLLVRDPLIIKRILVTDFKYFDDRNAVCNLRADPICCQTLFFLRNPKWKEVRLKVAPVYSSGKIKMMTELINKSADDMSNFLKQEKTDVIEMRQVLLKYAVNVISSTAFGIDTDCFANEKSPFYEIAKTLFNWNSLVTSFRIRCYFLAHTLVDIFRMRLFHPASIDFLAETFSTIMRQRQLSKTNRNDLIDLLLQLKENDKHFLEEDLLISQAVVFFLAGFESTASTLSFALHELAHNQEIQNKLRAEIHRVLQKHGKITYEAIREMEYLRMCFEETLRKYPVIPVLERKCNTQYTIPETGTVVDKDTAIFISTYGLQRDPEYFPDPEKFDPERFCLKNKHSIQAYTYLPLGAGPRNCIGGRLGRLSVSIGLIKIMKNFVLEACSDSYEIKFAPNALVLAPINGIRIKVKQIEK